MPNDDYIKRSDVMTAVAAWYMDVLHGENVFLDKTINDIHAADAEPVRHGYWYFRGGRPCCSVCNTKALWKDEGGTGGFSHEYVGAKSKWCPECGAKMQTEPPKEEDDA